MENVRELRVRRCSISIRISERRTISRHDSSADTTLSSGTIIAAYRTGKDENRVRGPLGTVMETCVFTLNMRICTKQRCIRYHSAIFLSLIQTCLFLIQTSV